MSGITAWNRGAKQLFGQLEAALWPSSIFTMSLEGGPTILDILLVYAIALVAKVLLYSLIGLLIWPVLRLFLRQRGENRKAS